VDGCRRARCLPTSNNPLGSAVDHAALFAQIVDASLTAAPGW